MNQRGLRQVLEFKFMGLSEPHHLSQALINLLVLYFIICNSESASNNSYFVNLQSATFKNLGGERASSRSLDYSYLLLTSLYYLVKHPTRQCKFSAHSEKSEI